jgi:hypothetical protein
MVSFTPVNGNNKLIIIDQAKGSKGWVVISGADLILFSTESCFFEYRAAKF